MTTTPAPMMPAIRQRAVCSLKLPVTTTAPARVMTAVQLQDVYSQRSPATTTTSAQRMRATPESAAPQLP